MKNNTRSITDFSQLIESLNESGIKNNVAVVWAEDNHTLDAVEMACKAGVITPILVCSQQTADKLKGKYETLSANDPQDASEKAVELVRQGKADALMKGFVNTDVLLRAILNKEKGILPKGSVLTHITAAKIPSYPKLLFFTDPAVLPFPTHEQRMEQIKYVSNFCHAFNIEQPKISLIHCSEKPDGKHFPYTEGYLELKKMAAEGAFGNCIVDGPLDLKTSCSAEALADKKIDSPIGGEADAVIFPDIEAGNVFYKTITLFAGA
ncbi:phosphate acyltransferase, partial [Prevotella nigrescens]